MPSKAVNDAVTARLATWSHIGACPHHDINSLSDSPADIFIDTEYPVSNERRKSICAPPTPYAEEGAIRFVIYTQTLDGVATALTYADEVRDLFRDKDDFTGLPTLQTFEASPPVFDSSITNRGFYPVPFVVTYQYDYTK